MSHAVTIDEATYIFVSMVFHLYKFVHSIYASFYDMLAMLSLHKEHMLCT